MGVEVRESDARLETTLLKRFMTMTKTVRHSMDTVPYQVGIQRTFASKDESYYLVLHDG